MGGAVLVDAPVVEGVWLEGSGGEVVFVSLAALVDVVGVVEVAVGLGDAG